MRNDDRAGRKPNSAATYLGGRHDTALLYALAVNGEDFPGNKAWPAVMALLAFFILSAFLQALLPAVGI